MPKLQIPEKQIERYVRARLRVANDHPLQREFAAKELKLAKKAMRAAIWRLVDGVSYTIP